MSASVAGRARKALDVCTRLTASRGADGLDELRRLYPGSRFYWEDEYGLMAFWNPCDGRDPPRAVSHSAGFLEILPAGPVVKDRVRDGASQARSMVEDIDVLDVMLS